LSGFVAKTRSSGSGTSGGNGSGSGRRSLPGIQETSFIAIDNEASQATRCKRSSVDINAIGFDFWPLVRCVTMNDDLPEILFAVQKFITNPQKIAHILPVKWHARSDAGVADETIPDANVRFERV
jgi:hypothetical protein